MCDEGMNDVLSSSECTVDGPARSARVDKGRANQHAAGHVLGQAVLQCARKPALRGTELIYMQRHAWQQACWPLVEAAAAGARACAGGAALPRSTALSVTSELPQGASGAATPVQKAEWQALARWHGGWACGAGMDQPRPEAAAGRRGPS